jgi:hypothetical protein
VSNGARKEFGPALLIEELMSIEYRNSYIKCLPFYARKRARTEATIVKSVLKLQDAAWVRDDLLRAF